MSIQAEGTLRPAYIATTLPLWTISDGRELLLWTRLGTRSNCPAVWTTYLPGRFNGRLWKRHVDHMKNYSTQHPLPENEVEVNLDLQSPPAPTSASVPIPSSSQQEKPTVVVNPTPSPTPAQVIDSHPPVVASSMVDPTLC